MPVLFVSHSSKDDAHIDALANWLRANGFTDFFIDHQKIAGGENWPEALRASAGSCRVVVCLVTPTWLGSLECARAASDQDVAGMRRCVVMPGPDQKVPSAQKDAFELEFAF